MRTTYCVVSWLLWVLLFPPPLFGDERGVDERPLLESASAPLAPHADGFAPAPIGELLPLPPGAARRKVDVRLPGEFERQELILLAYNDLATMFPQLFLKLAAELRTRTRVAVLVEAGQSRFLDELLAEHDLRNLQLDRVEVRHDTMWVRDYGPIVVQAPRGTRLAVDADYVQYGRAHDDAAPSVIAANNKFDVALVGLDLEGGNLLSNGDGLLLSTTACLANNAAHGRDELQVQQLFRECFGGDVLFLEPLAGEPTGHVDMFATFTATDTVVVGEYSPDVDAENAAILDRNAWRLSRLATSDGRPLKVIRIPMPDNRDGVWRTYTNVVMANGVLVVPVYPRLERNDDERALDVYHRAAPNWKVVSVDASELIESGGALHCVTMNVPAAASATSPKIEQRTTRPPSRLARRRLRVAPQPAGG